MGSDPSTRPEVPHLPIVLQKRLETCEIKKKRKVSSSTAWLPALLYNHLSLSCKFTLHSRENFIPRQFEVPGPIIQTSTSSSCGQFYSEPANRMGMICNQIPALEPQTTLIPPSWVPKSTPAWHPRDIKAVTL